MRLAATSVLVNSVWALIPVGVFVVLVLVIDQTSLSLHPFYTGGAGRGFASAGSTNRVLVPGRTTTRDDPLSKDAEPQGGFPAVTFAATANITGQDRTPPGRPGVPFMLAHDYIGGPATGWVRTDFLQKLAGKSVSGDLTVQAAVAISGAAFASAMGSQTRFYEVFLP